MRIKTAVRLLSVAPVLLAVVAAAIVFAASRRVDQAKAKQDLADKITRGVFELNVLTHEYTQQRLERARVQWLLKHQEAGGLAQKLEAGSQEERTLLDSFRRQHAQSRTLFLHLTEAAGRTSAGPVSPSGEWEELLVGQLLVRLRNMDAAARSLGRASRADFATAQREADRSLLVAAAAIVAVFLGGMAFFAAKIRPLAALQKAVQAAGEGNLDVAVRPEGHDEIAEICRAFNAMIRSLKQGRQELESEIAGHRRTAESLRESEQQRRLLLESVSDYAILMLDPQGRVTSWNVGAERISGHQGEDIIGRHFSVFFTLEDVAADRPEKELEIAARDGRFEEEGWRMRADGSPFWANVVVRAVRDEQGTLGGFAKVTRDITERKRARDAELLNETRLEALLRLNQMTGAPLREITDFALEAAVSLTGSNIGYLAFLNEDETVLTMHSWSKTAMAECAILDKPILYPVATTGLWGEAVRQRKPVITNDYQADNPLKKGYPEGHVRVLRHMNAPVFDGGHIVIVAGVGNKPSPYDESDVRQLTLLMQGMWQLLQRRRSQERLAHLNAVLNAARNVNQLIAREKQRDRLLEGVCRCLVETRGYRQAWAFLRGGPDAAPIWAETGVGELWPKLVERMRQGEVPPCVQECFDRRSIVVADPQRCAGALCPLFSACGDTDAVAVPVQHRGELYGILAVTLPREFSGDAEEQGLLEEVAGDVAFALRGLDLEKARAMAEDQIRRQAAILCGINEVFQEALTCDTDYDVAGRCLAVAEKLTQSAFGLIGEINERGRMDTIALSDPGWRNCRIPKSNATTMLRDMEVRGIWGQVIKEARPIVVNDPARHPNRIGMPEGHPPLSCFLGVPLLHGGKTIGMVGLANKESGYDLADQQAIEALSGGFVEALMRKRAEQGLRKAHDELETRVQQRTADLAQANAELERARETAEAGSHAKSTFLANMSHEIRTPLNAIIGMTELVLKSELSTKQREFLATVRDSGEALLSIINDVLDFSKIEAGKLFLEAEAFDLRERLGDTMKSFAIRAHQQGLELACFIHPEVPRRVVGDYNRLRQVVVNLVGNAIKFTPQGEVSLEAVVESRSAEGVTLHLTVTDTGIGIPQDKRSTIFEMFEQADNSMTRRHGGTGLGLAIAARLVSLMGGRIWVESEVGSGSRFHFTVSLRPAEEGPERPAPSEPAGLHGMRVLVVDDNATNRRILEETVQSWRMAPCAVPDAREAMRTLQQARRDGEPFRLVLTDAHMPEVDGFTLAGQIRQDKSLDSTVIMMLTSGDCPDDTARCDQLGIAAYLLKPVKQSELLEAIELALKMALPEDRSPRLVAPPPAPTRCLQILLAEDSPVNQKLAIALLESQGHSVTLARNGKEAVAAACTQKFDLLLMDVQMPEMDGLEAAAAIRAAERQAGGHVPIVAMTAHALKGDRERCLEAGMDGYVAKPIRAEELFETIHALFADPHPAAATGSKAPGEVVNWSEALKIVRGNRDLLESMTEAAAEEAPRLVSAIRLAVAERDSRQLRFSAHALKGELRYFGANRVCRCAAELESIGQAGDMEGAATMLDLLETEVAKVTAALREHVRRRGPEDRAAAHGEGQGQKEGESHES